MTGDLKTGHFLPQYLLVINVSTHTLLKEGFVVVGIVALVSNTDSVTSPLFTIGLAVFNGWELRVQMPFTRLFFKVLVYCKLCVVL